MNVDQSFELVPECFLPICFLTSVANLWLHGVVFRYLSLQPSTCSVVLCITVCLHHVGVHPPNSLESDDTEDYKEEDTLFCLMLLKVTGLLFLENVTIVIFFIFHPSETNIYLYIYSFA